MRARGSASVPSPRVTTITQITHDGYRKTNLLADDNQLYVTELPASQRVIARVSLAHSDRSLVPSPFSNLQALDLSPDHTKLLVAPIQAGSSEDEFWTLPVAAGSAQRIGNLAGRDAAWSADGQHLVFSKGSVLYLASATGTEVRELYTAIGSVFGPHFSPDGKRIRFTVGDTAQNTTALWEVGQDGSNHMLCWRSGNTRPAPAVAIGPLTGAITFSRHCRISPTRARLSPRCGLCQNPRKVSDAFPTVRLTSAPMSFGNASPARDNTKMWAIGVAPAG